MSKHEQHVQRVAQAAHDLRKPTFRHSKRPASAILLES